MRILFMGTPDFALESLKAIYYAGHEIIGVVTNPDRPKGRGMKMCISPVKEFALEKNLKIFQPEKIRKNEEFINEIRNMNPEVICVVAYGKILPKEILDIPEKGCINVHGSLLPKYRGAAPIQWAVLNGDKYTGVTTMYMDVGMDTGDMILKEQVEIGENETTGELWDKLMVVGGNLLVETLKQIENGTVKREKQGDDFTIAPMLNKEMSKIDWTKSAEQIKNLVRGLNPIMGAYTFYNDKKLKFWTVRKTNIEELEKNGINIELNELKPGMIIYANDKKGMYIQTVDGILNVLEIQGENQKKMNICDFLRGNRLQVGSILK